MEDYFGNTLFDTTFLYNDKLTSSKGHCTDVVFDRAIECVEKCRHFPREANKPAEATVARLKIGESIVESVLDNNATHARFEVNLKAGDYDLETFMSAEGESPRCALFVYVSRK